MKRTAVLFLLSLSVMAMAEPPQFTLINGRPAEPGEYPASVWTRSCTASVVGPQAVFIAAHCVSSGRIQFTVGANRYSARCRISREYARGNSTADYAMCETDKVVSGIPYEVLNSDPNRVKRGDRVILTGYGCVRSGGGGGNDGVYRVGRSTVRRLPSGRNNDIVTSGEAALCFGDSGGPAFHVDGNGERVLISTNSRGNIRDTSYLSATHTTEAQRFFRAWSAATGKKMCGIHADVSGCRNGEGGSLPTQFNINHSVLNLSATMKPGYESRLEDAKSSIEQILDDMQ